MSMNKALIALALGLSITACSRDPEPASTDAVVCTFGHEESIVDTDVSGMYDARGAAGVVIRHPGVGSDTVHYMRPGETCKVRRFYTQGH